MTVTREDIVEQQYTLEESVRAEIMALRSSGQLGDGFKSEPRCHVCCDVESRELVNTLLAAMLTNAQITKSCEAINNRRRDAGDSRIINARSVWNHRREHFPIQQRTAAIARQIIERRAEQANVDFVNGVGHAITPYGVLETAMALGLQAMTADQALPPTVKETIDSAVKLQEMTSKDAGERHYADLLYKMDRIISIAEKYVPQDQREAFVAEVESGEPKAMTVLSERVHDQAQKAAVKVFAPKAGMDEGDEI